jgi:virginiamycin B lyase
LSKYNLVLIDSILLASTIALFCSIYETASAASTTPLPAESSYSIVDNYTIKEFPIQVGSHPHDVAPATTGPTMELLPSSSLTTAISSENNNAVWYTVQALGELGKLDKITGETHSIPLGKGSAPHGVIIGPDNAPWVTDGGLNAIVRVDPVTENVIIFPLPKGSPYANLNTATFDKNGTLWFTGQSGIYGKLNVSSGQIKIFDAPRGPGPYGISTTPNGTVYFASLAGSYIGRIDAKTGSTTVIEPPTPDQGPRRVWSDSQGNIWISEWNVGKLGMYDPSNNKWKEWKLPGVNPMPYAIFVDKKDDKVWLSDFGANALLIFDPNTEKFETFKIPSPNANVRQILGGNGEIWGAESGTDKLLVVNQTGSG